MNRSLMTREERRPYNQRIRERRAAGIERVCAGGGHLVIDQHGHHRDSRNVVVERGEVFSISLAEHETHLPPTPGCNCSACRACRVATAAARVDLASSYFATPGPTIAARQVGPVADSGVVEFNRHTRTFSHVAADAGADDDPDLHHAVRAGGHVLAPVAAAPGRIARRHEGGGLVTHQRGGSALVTFASHDFHDLQPECNCPSCRGHRVIAAFARRGKRGVTLVAAPSDDERGHVTLFGYRSQTVVGSLSRDIGRFDMPLLAEGMAGCQCGGGGPGCIGCPDGAVSSYSVTLGGSLTNAACSDCAALEDVTVDYGTGSGDDCIFGWGNSSGCGSAGHGVALTIHGDGSATVIYSIAASVPEPRYELASFDCNGSNTFTLAASPDTHCTGWPSTLTVAPA